MVPGSKSTVVQENSDVLYDFLQRYLLKKDINKVRNKTISKGIFGEKKKHLKIETEKTINYRLTCC